MEKKMENEMETREYMGIILGVILGLYRDNGKEHGNHHVGFRVGLGFRRLGDQDVLGLGFMLSWTRMVAWIATQYVCFPESFRRIPWVILTCLSAWMANIRKDPDHPVLSSQQLFFL